MGKWANYKKIQITATWNRIKCIYWPVPPPPHFYAKIMYPNISVFPEVNTEYLPGIRVTGKLKFWKQIMVTEDKQISLFSTYFIILCDFEVFFCFFFQLESLAHLHLLVIFNIFELSLLTLIFKISILTLFPF